MKPFRQSNLVEVRRNPRGSRKGRGVFARRDIKKGELIERVPVILIPKNEVFGDSDPAGKACRISWYVFNWDSQFGREYIALALGYGSMYNHSYEPNSDYLLDSPDILEIVAVQRIMRGEEITINYNGDVHDRSPVGFPVED